MVSLGVNGIVPVLNATHPFRTAHARSVVAAGRA